MIVVRDQLKHIQRSSIRRFYSAVLYRLEPRRLQVRFKMWWLNKLTSEINFEFTVSLIVFLISITPSDIREITLGSKLTGRIFRKYPYRCSNSSKI